MKCLHLIQPMGGGGTRFGNKGFDVPKPIIKLQDKPFFYWAVQSVVKYADVADITCVVLKDHVKNYHIDEEILSFYPDAKIVVIDHVLDGAVLTCIEGVKNISDNGPILFNDCDHAFLCEEFYTFVKNGDFSSPSGALLTFSSDSPAYSYVRYDAGGNVCGTIEKEVVSNDAICGAYYFKNKDIFIGAAEKYLKDCKYDEFFMSGVYNKMIEAENSMAVFRLDEHISYGTPDEYDLVLQDSRLRRLDR